MDTLPINWYFDTPIDFEYKQYILLGYLQQVEMCFIAKNLSPHLLHMEKMVSELNNFKISYENYKQDFDKHRYIYLFDDNSKILGEDDDLILELKEIVNFSIPQIHSRIDFGYKVFNKNKQILY